MTEAGKQMGRAASQVTSVFIHVTSRHMPVTQQCRRRTMGKKSEVFGTVLSFLPQSKSWSVWRMYYSEIILMLNQLAGGKINLEETHQREIPRPLY